MTRAMMARLHVITVISSSTRMGAKTSIPNGNSTPVPASTGAVLLPSSMIPVVAKLVMIELFSIVVIEHGEINNS